MGLNPQETTDLVPYTEETLNGKLHFLCSVIKILPFSHVNPSRVALRRKINSL